MKIRTHEISQLMRAFQIAFTVLLGRADATEPPFPNATTIRPQGTGTLYARGHLFQNGRRKGIAVVVIDAETGAWKRLIDAPVDQFTVSRDNQTIVFSKEGAIWNGDAATNANPGKVFSTAGRVIFSPDNRSMLVATRKRKMNQPNDFETTVLTMQIDGTSAVSLVNLAGCDVRDWSSDGKWLLVQNGDAVELLSPDGKERRRLLEAGFRPRFSADGKRVIAVQPWSGAILTISVDGTGEKLAYQAPPPTYAALARFSPDGRRAAIVLEDLTLGGDGQARLQADPKSTHPRISLIDLDTGAPSRLDLRVQAGWEFLPSGGIEWR